MNEPKFIFTFHGIGSPVRAFWPREKQYWVEPDFFHAVLDEIADRDDVMLTFDDGNISDVEIALPALMERGLRAHFFIVTAFLGKYGFVSKDATKVLHEVGMVIGNHGRFHRSWRELRDEQLREEVVEARDELENLIGERISCAACPNGSYDRRVLSCLKSNGYERVFTCDRGWTDAGEWLQARNSMLRSLSLEDVRELLGKSPLSLEALAGNCKRLIKRWR
jgi:peptidoglycan/xylan/chitin deacetylase (PgdA/CDA1 family)